MPPLIVHIIFRLDIGGLENGLVNLINNIDENRYRHAIICQKSSSSFRDRLNRDDVSLHVLDKKDGIDIGMYYRTWKLIRELAPDIVHTRNLSTLDLVFPVALASRAKRVHGEHGWDVGDLHGDNWKYRLLRRSCSPLVYRYIAVSDHLKQWLCHSIGIPDHKIKRICNGVDTRRFTPREVERPRLRQDDFLQEGTIVVGSVGRLAAVKDQLSLVKAFSSLVRTVDDGRRRFRLLLVGDGPMREELQAALARHEIESISWLPGGRDDIDKLMKYMDIFVLPSLNEGISNTILEAMASGLPVIATDVGGNPELVSHDQTGFLVPANDPDALVPFLKRYADDSALRRHHGQQSRLRAEQEFSIDGMVKGYLDVYDEALRASSAGR
jgi:sugar transferase (PEP-CTERM/EpsH1 system associated)